MNWEPSHRLNGSFVLRVIRKRAPLFALSFAVLFTLIAVAQYLFVRQGVYDMSERELKDSANLVVSEINYKDHWSLTAHQQSSDSETTNTVIFTSQGTLLELGGFIPGLIGKVKLPDVSIFGGPKTVKEPQTGDVFREYAVRLKGGFVALGILDPEHVSDPDGLLKSTSLLFGKTIEDASRVSSRMISNEIEYAIVDDAGEVLYAQSWLPLELEPATVLRLSQLRGLIKAEDKTYQVYAQPIMAQSGEVVGTVLVHQDVSGEQRVINEHILFNGATTLISWLSALLLVVGYHVVEDWRNRPRAATVEEALKSGECQTIEFKEGRPDKTLAAAMAAFANTNSGTLFLGIKDDGSVVGVGCDSPASRDEELKRIRQIAVDKIKPAISVTPDFIEYGGKVILRIFVPRTNQPLCFVDHEIYVREQSSSMKATPEQVERILTKFYRLSGRHGERK